MSDREFRLWLIFLVAAGIAWGILATIAVLKVVLR